MVTLVPPASGPEVWLTAVTVGVDVYEKPSADDVVDVPPTLETVTSTEPDGWLGEVTVIDVSELTLNAAMVVPKLTVVARVKPDPVTATVVPPLREPVAGATAVTVGTGT
jgi:hypothetical protein